MAVKLCSELGCSGIARSRGLCRKHYARWRRHGTTGEHARPDFEQVARDAVAEALVALAAKKLLTGSPTEVCAALGMSPGELKAALDRRAHRRTPPRKGQRIGPNRKAPVGMKWCNKGKHFVLLSGFNRNRGNSDGLAGYCRECNRKYMRAFYARKSRKAA